MTQIRKILVSLGLLTFSVGAFSATLEECSALLPEGHSYKVSIILDIDKSAEKAPDTPSFSGEFSVSGGTDEALNFDIREFVECAGPLIKNVETDSQNKS